MFLIDCPTDNSLLIVDSKDVICDKNTVKCGDLVSFFHKKEKYKGIVLKISDDYDVLKAERKKICNQGKHNKPKLIENKPLSSKRIRKTPNAYSPSMKLKNKKIKISTDDNTTLAIKYTKNLQCEKDLDNSNDSISENEILNKSPLEERHSKSDSSSSDNENFSQNKDSKEIDNDNDKNTQQVDDNQCSQEIEDVAIHNQNDDQLYGQNYTGDTMIHLAKGIYCKKQDWIVATRECTSATAVARNLLIGVFKTETLLQATVTGQAGRAHGSKTNKPKMLRLDDDAKEVIIDYAMNIATKKGWGNKKGNTIDCIKKSLSQKIVEIKNTYKKNLTESNKDKRVIKD